MLRLCLLPTMLVLMMLGSFTLRSYAQTSEGSSGQATSEQSTAQPQAAQQQTTTEKPPVSPLVGATSFGTGTSSAAHNYFLPSFQWTGYYDSNPSGLSDTSKRIAQSTYIADFKVQRVNRHSQFNVDYSGGAFLYKQAIPPTQTTPLNNYGFIHQLQFTEQLTSRRWGFLIGGKGSYLPESPIGFAGLGGLTSFGTELSGPAFTAPGINSLLSPSQSLLSTRARRVSGVSTAQIQYSPSARSTLSVTGSFATLQFLEPGFINSTMTNIMAGYTHQITWRDYVGITYVHSLIHFHVPNQDMLNRGFLLSYGHKITGRLSFMISAGSLANEFARPQGGSVTRSFITTQDALRYVTPTYELSASFERGVSGGSGLLTGAETDYLRATVGRRFFRRYHTTLNFEHGYNKSLVQVSAGQRRAEVELWGGGGTISRELGSHLSLYLDYRVQRQIVGESVCTAAGICAETFTRQTGGAGINFHARPTRVD